ncbi:hypothetical protein Tco_0028010 [Tanacetum coccineum]
MDKTTACSWRRVAVLGGAGFVGLWSEKNGEPGGGVDFALKKKKFKKRKDEKLLQFSQTTPNPFLPMTCLTPSLPPPNSQHDAIQNY